MILLPSSCLLSTTGVLYSVLGSRVQGRDGENGVSPVQGHEGGWGIGACDIWRESERLSVRRRWEKAQADVIV